jgi:nucleotide-binding universal stress UspA family protein
MFTHILLPVDGSELSLRAARHGLELARVLNARLTVMTVTTPWATQFSRELAVVVPDVIVPKGEYDNKKQSIAAGILRNVTADAQRANVSAKALHCCHRDPYQAIVDAALHENCDLIVMGSHGRRGIWGGPLGRETTKVLIHSSVPVLVYRETFD